MEERFARLEGVLVSQFASLQREIAQIKLQQTRLIAHGPSAATEADDPEELARHAAATDARSAQEKLESTIRRVYDQFATFDVDGSGALSPAEVGAALNSLGSLPGGREATADDIEQIMRQYDRDMNGVLDADEFKVFVRDLVLHGKLDFRDELQQAVEKIAIAAKEDPWSDVLRGDSGVRSMIDHLRGDSRRGGRSLARGETGLRRLLSCAETPKAATDPYTPGANVGGESTVRGTPVTAATSRVTCGTPSSGRHSPGTVRRELKARDELSGTANFEGYGGRGRPRSWGARTATVCWCCLCLWIPVMHPDSRFRSVWNSLMAFLIVYCGVIVPMEIAFERALESSMGETGWEAFEVWNLIVDFTFIVDLVLNFRTGFLVEGLLITDSKRIAKHYVQTSFWIDAVGSFPLNLLLTLINQDDSDDDSPSNVGRLNRQLRLLRLVKLNRLLRLSKLSKNLKYVELAIKFNPSAMRVFKLIVIMLLCCHWMGCSWWFVADLELHETATPMIPFNNWQPDEESLSSNATLGTKFSKAFFWGSGMVTAMLPYDIDPTTEVEAYFTTACMFIGLVLNAFVIGSMASALSTMDSKKAVAAGKLRTIEAYLQINSVGPELRSHILEFYEYLYTSTQSMEDLKLYQDLPPSLATRLAISVHRRVVARAPFLYALSDDALLAVLGRLKALIYAPGQVVVVEGQPLKAIYFVKKGRVVLLKNMGTPDEKELRVVSQYDNFGMYISAAGPKGVRATDTEVASQLLTVQVAQESARAETYCDVVCLSAVDLGEIFTQARLWSKLAAQRKRKTVSGVRSSGVMKAAVFASRLSRRRRSSSTERSTAATTPPAASPAATTSIDTRLSPPPMPQLPPMPEPPASGVRRVQVQPLEPNCGS